ncbi:N-acetylmuramoyl-L-alanine amidase [Roseitranquillus sediminis]|uniref:N-acetylmuramoyl-L-alanine amidase n=1 Tax=Roseitranquillus sediminis TaxID=2809051 RepID=UPI001D0C151C|nr:N-acetylmuramoyl-L-alanine amidase [Roseitranquillus sediminis]MBM9595318.1 N-acetylmuramoyl-L-alanine amidase [Roseitranquillus sediminis]
MIHRPSPNHGPRRGGVRPDLIVLHYTAMERDAALERLCDPAAAVSSHWLIDRRGEAFHLVDEELRAWHAGMGSWGAVTDVNSRSIGIELEGDGSQYPAPLMEALTRLLRDIMARRDIHPARVIGHSDMAPGRKCDPGPLFDWRGLAHAGLSVWPEAGEDEPSGTDAALLRFGYPAFVSPQLRLEAFRLRFRPGASGPADAVDAGLAFDLARRFPIDRWDKAA